MHSRIRVSAPLGVHAKKILRDTPGGALTARPAAEPKRDIFALQEFFYRIFVPNSVEVDQERARGLETAIVRQIPYLLNNFQPSANSKFRLPRDPRIPFPKLCSCLHPPCSELEKLLQMLMLADRAVVGTGKKMFQLGGGVRGEILSPADFERRYGAVIATIRVFFTSCNGARISYASGAQQQCPRPPLAEREARKQRTLQDAAAKKPPGLRRSRATEWRRTCRTSSPRRSRRTLLPAVGSCWSGRSTGFVAAARTTAANQPLRPRRLVATRVPENAGRGRERHLQVSVSSSSEVWPGIVVVGGARVVTVIYIKKHDS